MQSSAQRIKDVKNQVKQISVEQLQQRLSDGELILVDVRENEEFQQAHIPGAVNIPRGMLEMKITSHPAVSHHCDEQQALNDLASRKVFLICKTGGRSALSALALQEMGHPDAISVEGGMDAWQKQFATISG